MNDSIEILAPGGSFDSLKAAIDSGADAVYFGGLKFGARTNAVNLTNDQITEAVRYAHLRSAKLYVTVNTLVADNELSEAYDFIKFCYDEGVDGVIVQDMGIVNIVKNHFPDFRIHASTQMTIHNLYGALEAKKMGFDRVVLSRELSLDEIKYISANCDIELEVFVHGALCMSYSGQCLFSSFLGGRSGNRGSCAQPCRLPYTLLDGNGNRISEQNKYLLSLKDLCLIDYISELKSSGVTSFKIEGRMKSEAYVSAVCGIYSKYLNGGMVSLDDKALLENIFSRNGFTDGFLKDEHGRNMICYSTNHDNIFASATDDVIESAMSLASKKHQISVSAAFEMKLGNKASFTLSYKGNTFTVFSNVVSEAAAKAPTTKERIYDQLSKLGGTLFEFSSLEIDVEDGIYFPIKEINDMRRKAILLVENFILQSARSRTHLPFVLIKPEIAPPDPALTASVLTYDQACTAYDLGFERIYIPYNVYISDKNHFDNNEDIYCVKLPPIMHDSRNIDLSEINIKNICAQNFGQLYLSNRFNVHADYRLNTFNSLAIKQLKQYGACGCTLSPELTLFQMKDMSKAIPTEIVIYGRISLMTVRNCIIKSSKGKCDCSEKEMYYLKDRKNICFPLITDKKSCTNIIYNSIPVVMSDKMDELSEIGASMYRFDFTTETSEEIKTIISMYENNKKCKTNFTRGHFYNGVQ